MEEEEDEKEEKCALGRENFARDRKKCMAAIERMEKEERRGPMKYIRGNVRMSAARRWPPQIMKYTNAKRVLSVKKLQLFQGSR